MSTLSRPRKARGIRQRPSAQWSIRWVTPAPRCPLPAPSSISTTKTRRSVERETR